MSHMTRTQRLHLPQAQEHRRRRNETNYLLAAAAVAVVALVVIVVVVMAQMNTARPVPDAVIAITDQGEEDRIAASIAARQTEATSTDTKTATPAAPSPAPAPENPAAPIDLPNGDLNDEEEDAIDEAPASADVPDGQPSPPATESEDVPAAPLPPVDLDPVDPGPVVDGPCQTILANGENLLVEDPVVLAHGALSSEITIKNCGANAVTWTAATKPWVALSNESGNLSAGSSTELGLTVDRNAVDAGAFEFKVKVSEPGANTYVDVTGFRATVGMDHVATDQLSAGLGAGGCANSCIRRAELVSNATSANLTIEIETTVPAAINVWVSQNAPVEDGAGNPSLPGVGLAAFSPGQITSWNASLTGLQPATLYHIVVEARDNNGKVTVEVGSFTTITPVVLPDQFINEVPGACSQQCITESQVHFSVGGTTAFLHTETTHAAYMIAFVSDDDISYSNGVPTFGSIDASVASEAYVTEWSPTIGGLTPGVDYNLIVQATDEFGNSAHHVGSIMIPVDLSNHTVDLVIAPLRVTITNDADNVGRGELRFGWQVGDRSVGTRGEDRMNTGDSFGLPSGAQYHFQDVDLDSFVPQVAITAFERDPDGLIEFSTSGFGPRTSPDHGEIDSADVKWNTAVSGLDQVGTLEDLPRCSEFGITGAWANFPCNQIATLSYGNSYPGFTAIVAFQVSEDIPAPLPGP